MYEKRSTRDENLREGARKANLVIDSFEDIDETLKMLPEKEADFLDQLIADLIQIIIQDTTSIKNAIAEDYNDKLWNTWDDHDIPPEETDKKVMYELSTKYVMPEEEIEAIINMG